MGGIIEDKIFEVLMNEKMDVDKIRKNLEDKRCERSHSVVYNHLRRMFYTGQLEREKDNSGKYVYYNPCMFRK